jgi:hypothetical protein
LHNPFAFDTREWRFRSAQQERRHNVSAFEPLILNSFLKRLDVGDDVRQFRHRFLTILASLTIPKRMAVALANEAIAALGQMIEVSNQRDNQTPRSKAKA